MSDDDTAAQQEKGVARPSPSAVCGDAGSVWTRHAGQWSRIGSPLRPVAEDVAVLGRYLADVPAAAPVLLLGITAELRALPLSLTAVDNNPAQVEAWAATPARPGETVQLGDWRALDTLFPAGHFVAAVGDGCLNMLHYPDGYVRVFDALAAVLHPGGTFACRLFAAPETPESLEAVMQDAQGGCIGSFHAFKWRFAQALAAAGGTPNIAVAAVYEAFAAQVPDRAAFAARAGWEPAQVDTIDAYRGAAAVYSFPALSRLTDSLPAGWRLDAVTHPSYELGARCPILRLIHEKR